jgi:uncharacterized protein YjaG (DUF416 family)
MIRRNLTRGEILEHLELLSQRHRAAYAIACAERMLPLYEWFQQIDSWGDYSVLVKGIDIVWTWINTEWPQDREIANTIRACEKVTPNTEDFHSALASRALDAASAVAQALEVCLSPLTETAADAGDIAWECTFGLEQSRLVDTTGIIIADKRILERAAQGRLVLLEEDLQRRSLEYLKRTSLTSEEAARFRQDFSHLYE